MKRSASVSSRDLIGKCASARIDACVIVPRVTDFHARRAFLKAAAAAGAAWATADLFEVEDALAFASQQASAPVGAQSRALTPAQMEAVSALTSRILPAIDGRPGATE